MSCSYLPDLPSPARLRQAAMELSDINASLRLSSNEEATITAFLNDNRTGLVCSRPFSSDDPEEMLTAFASLGEVARAATHKVNARLYPVRHNREIARRLDDLSVQADIEQRLRKIINDIPVDDNKPEDEADCGGE